MSKLDDKLILAIRNAVPVTQAYPLVRELYNSFSNSGWLYKVIIRAVCNQIHKDIDEVFSGVPLTYDDILQAKSDLKERWIAQ